MINAKQIEINRAKKEALYFKELSAFFFKITQDDPALAGIHLTAVRLSSDKSVCNLFFSAEGGEEEFNQKLKFLILYKPSLRKGLSQAINARYTPQLVFKYDKQFEKQTKLENLFDTLKKEGKL